MSRHGLLLLLSHVMTDGAAADSAKAGMVAGHMTGDAADDRAADTAGLRDAASRKRRAQAQNQDQRCLHVALHIGDDRPIGNLQIDVDPVSNAFIPSPGHPTRKR
jgi:hypothetical protein